MNIGFISTRLAGTDGVSLETAKLATIYTRMGHTVFYCAGELDEGLPGHLVPAMHFQDPEAKWIHDHSFGTTVAPPDLRSRIEAMRAMLRIEVHRFIEDYGLDLLIPQNALAIPMQIPLGLAITDVVAATGIPTVAHNHDLYWERARFAENCIPDLLDYAFPPALPNVRHLVINSPAREALRARLGVDADLLPNIFDFASAAPGMTEFNRDLRTALGLTDRHLMVLQPTRVIARKGIELSLELLHRLRLPENQAQLDGLDPVLVITHHAGDEGLAYLHAMDALAAQMDVPLLYAAERFAPEAAMVDGQKIYSLWDAYVHADFVTYPSLIEGFGNALIETLYFRVPALVNRYDVYAADLATKGFDLIEIDGAITDDTVAAVIDTVVHSPRRRRMVEWNYDVARTHYSYEAVTPLLASLLPER